MVKLIKQHSRKNINDIYQKTTIFLLYTILLTNFLIVVTIVTLNMGYILKLLAFLFFGVYALYKLDEYGKLVIKLK